MEKMFLLMSVCFVPLLSASAEDIKNIMANLSAVDDTGDEYVWKPTGPTAEDLEAFKTKELDLALEKGDLPWIKNFVQQGGNLNTNDRMGRPLLVSAVFYKHMHILQYLVEKGADINKRSDYVMQGDERGNTALMKAVQANNLPMVQYLVEHGADLNIPNNLNTSSELTVVQWVKLFSSRPMKEYFEKISSIKQNNENTN